MTRRTVQPDPLLVRPEFVLKYRSVKTGRWVRLTREQFLASVSERAAR